MRRDPGRTCGARNDATTVTVPNAVWGFGHWKTSGLDAFCHPLLRLMDSSQKQTTYPVVKAIASAQRYQVPHAWKQEPIEMQEPLPFN